MLRMYQVGGGGYGDDEKNDDDADKDCHGCAQSDIYLLRPLNMSQLHVM